MKQILCLFLIVLTIMRLWLFFFVFLSHALFRDYRESRFAGCVTFKAKTNHKPKSSSELALVAGDYVFVRYSDMQSVEGPWKQATSWLSGCTGSVHIGDLKRVPDSDAWMLHKCVYSSNSLERLNLCLKSSLVFLAFSFIQPKVDLKFDFCVLDKIFG